MVFYVYFLTISRILKYCKYCILTYVLMLNTVLGGIERSLGNNIGQYCVRSQLTLS